jgi:hypothetical protein
MLSCPQSLYYPGYPDVIGARHTCSPYSVLWWIYMVAECCLYTVPLSALRSLWLAPWASPTRLAGCYGGCQWHSSALPHSAATALGKQPASLAGHHSAIYTYSPPRVRLVPACSLESHRPPLSQPCSHSMDRARLID